MEQDTVLKKDLYSMSGFDAKRIFKGQMVKILKKRCFQPTMQQNTVFKRELYCMTGFDAKRIFERETVKTC